MPSAGLAVSILGGLANERGQRRLAGQVRVVGRPIGDPFAGRFGTQGVVVVCADAEDADHVGNRVLVRRQWRVFLSSH